MISLINHDSQWGRSEVVIIYPDVIEKCTARSSRVAISRIVSRNALEHFEQITGRLSNKKQRDLTQPTYIIDYIYVCIYISSYIYTNNQLQSSCLIVDSSSQTSPMSPSTRFEAHDSLGAVFRMVITVIPLKNMGKSWWSSSSKSSNGSNLSHVDQKSGARKGNLQFRRIFMVYAYIHGMFMVY